MAEGRRQRGARATGGAVRLPLLFVALLGAVVGLHATLLRLPYFWDEAGYYIPAAWDFWRLGTLIPQSTMSNAHPPLPSVLSAVWWRLLGFHILSTRLLVCVVAAAALTGVYRLAEGRLGGRRALAVTALTAVYPVWFAQSTLAHADVFAAAFTVWGLAFFLERRPVWVAALFSLAVLSKETAILTPTALFAVAAFEAWHGRSVAGITPRHALWGQWRLASAAAFPVVPLLGWYAYHRAKTGFIFGNPEYLRYNATANLSALRVALSLWHRLIHLSVHMNLFVPVGLAVAVLLLPRLPEAGAGWRAGRAHPSDDEAAGRMGYTAGLSRQAVWALGAVLLVHWVGFSVLGGALLTRYLLPDYPLVLLLCVASWSGRVRWWPAMAALSLLGFAVGCEVNPPYPFAPEDNLAYRDMVVLHEQAIKALQQRSPGATVLTAWPATGELKRPELGYTAVPYRTAEIANFTREEVAKAATDPGAYDAALVFSTKYNPPPGGLDLAQLTHASDGKYFDAHRDMLPEEVALTLGGTVVWQAERKGQWAALLRFPRSYEAGLRGAAEDGASASGRVFPSMAPAWQTQARPL